MAKLPENPFSKEDREDDFFDDLSRSERRGIESMLRRGRSRASTRMAAEGRTGAGYRIDQHLRRRMVDLTNTGWEGADFYYPGVYAFFKTETDKESGLPFLLMKQERDHLLSFADLSHARRDAMYEVVTATVAERLGELPEEIVHHYSPIGKAAEFKDGGRYGFVVAGISMVRKGDGIFFSMLGGLTGDLKAFGREYAEMWAEDLEEMAKEKSGPVDGKQLVREIKKIIANSYLLIGLEGDPDAGRVYVEGGYDIPSGVIQDLAITPDMGGTSLQMPVEIPEASGWVRLIGELCKMALELPAYFGVKVHVSQSLLTPRKRTATALPAEAPDDAETLGRTDPSPLRFRKVVTLEVELPSISPDGQPGRERNAPQWQVQVEGFYRRLRPGAIGRNSEGQPVEGKTWVTGHTRWNEKPERRRQVLVKEPVMVAMSVAGEMIGQDPSARVTVRA